MRFTLTWRADYALRGFNRSFAPLRATVAISSVLVRFVAISPDRRRFQDKLALHVEKSFDIPRRPVYRESYAGGCGDSIQALEGPPVRRLPHWPPTYVPSVSTPTVCRAGTLWASAQQLETRVAQHLIGLIE